MRRVVGEKERQLEVLRTREASLKEECQKHKETIRRITDDAGSSTGYEKCVINTFYYDVM